MGTDNQETKKDLNVVWENLSDGTRFMTPFTEGSVYNDNEHHKVIGKELCYDDALVLVKQTEDLNIASFLGDLPPELRDPETDAFIAAMIKSGGKA